jgi:hypothetical protein
VNDNITLPREVVQEAVKALEFAERNHDGEQSLYTTEIAALRKALAAEQPKHDLMKWAKDAGSSPEDLERFATYTIATRDMEIATLREENEALRRDAERYRWLRDNAAGFSGRTLDAAIDAAMGDKT